MTRRVRLLLGVVAAVLAVLPGAPEGVSSTEAQSETGTVMVEWLGHNFWRVTSATGKVILLNPLVNNPDSPVSLDDISRADLILVTNGHPDEVGQTVQIAQRTGARVIGGAFELGLWLIDRGVPSAQVTLLGGPGDRARIDGITVRLTNAVHGSGLLPPSENVPYGGPASAFMITFENGWTLYYGGSTSATQDQALVASMHRPDAAVINLAGAREPMDFAMQVKLLTTDNPNLSAVFPGHHRVVQQGTTIAEAQQAVWDMGLTHTVIEPLIGQVYSYTK